MIKNILDIVPAFLFLLFSLAIIVLSFTSGG
jgi:hypothetical protein